MKIKLNENSSMRICDRFTIISSRLLSPQSNLFTYCLKNEKVCTCIVRVKNS